MLAGGSEVLGYATEALVLAGDWDGAQHELEGALQVADTLEERVYLPQLFVMQAAIARARGDRAAADAAIRRAIAEARAQEAPWLELIALIELCDRHSATAKDRRALAALIDQLPEALDTPAGGKARALLDKTKSSRPSPARCWLSRAVPHSRFDDLTRRLPGGEPALSKFAPEVGLPESG
jgi:hypothetical protein